MTSPAVSDRARSLAADAGLGDWDATDRVNRRTERFQITYGVVGVLIGAAAGALALNAADIATWLRILGVLVGVAILLFGVVLIVRGAALRRVGPLYMHRFADGFVLEREHGQASASPYADVTAELARYREPRESDSRGAEFVLLKITATDGGVRVLTDAAVEAEAIRQLAERLDAEELPEMRFADAMRLRRRHGV